MIELWDGYVIESDDYNYVLGRPVERKGKDGQTEIRLAKATYHPTLAGAVLAFYKVQARDCVMDGPMTLSAWLGKARAIEERLREMLAEPDFADQLEKGE